MDKKFLPSREFLIRVSIIVILTLGAFSIYKIINFIKNRPANSSAVKLINKIEKVADDGNDNGIPDWEERLWGLDPNKDGAENKEYIIAKRKALNPNVDLSRYEKESLSDNETLTREFFAIIMSLQQTGDLDQDAIEAISSAYSQKIEAKPLEDAYSIDILKVVSDTDENMTRYSNEFNNLILKYKDSNMGDELTFLIQAIAYNDPQVAILVEDVATSYEGFSKDLMQIPTPEMMSFLSISLANAYEKNARTTKGLSLIFSDPFEATKSIVNYKKYNNLLSEVLLNFSSVFETE